MTPKKLGNRISSILKKANRLALRALRRTKKSLTEPLQISQAQQQQQPTQLAQQRQQPTQTLYQPTNPPSMTLYDIAQIMRLREQEEAFVRDIERGLRTAEMGYGMRGLGTSSIAAATQAALIGERARGLAGLRRQALLDTLNIRQQLMQQLGQLLTGASSMIMGEASLAGQIGLSALGGAERIGGTLFSTLGAAISGLGAAQGYNMPPIEISLPTTQSTTQPITLPTIDITPILQEKPKTKVGVDYLPPKIELPTGIELPSVYV